jgi:Domain of unknown function (DUF4124)
MLKFASCLLPLALALTCAPVQAEIYKCTKDGKVEYANVPCEKDAKPAALKGNVTVVNKSAFVGKEGKDPKASVLPKPLDPVGDCKRKGGEIDPEFKACRLP